MSIISGERAKDPGANGLRSGFSLRKASFECLRHWEDIWVVVVVIWVDGLIGRIRIIGHDGLWRLKITGQRNLESIIARDV